MVYSQYQIIFTLLMMIIIRVESIVKSLSSKSVCTPTKVRKLLVANCSDLNMTQIPTNLNANIQVLDLDYNPLTALKQSSFKSFSSLVYLTYRLNSESSHHCEIDDNAFENLLSLKTLDLGRHQLGSSVKLRFPPNIWNLRLDHTKLTDNLLNVMHLQHLMTFVASNNKLTAIPVFYATAPLRYIDLRNNPIFLVLAEVVAKYCELEFLYINITLPMVMNPDCSCILLQKWISFTGVQGFNISAFKCMNVQCSVTQGMINDRNQCLLRKSRKNETDVNYDDYFNTPEADDSSSKLYVIIPALILTTVIVGVCCFVYRKRKHSSSSVPTPQSEEVYNDIDENEPYNEDEEN